MAGKHTAVADNLQSTEGFAFDPKLDKAYAEGRANIGSAPEWTGTPANKAWLAGFFLRNTSTQQFETAVE